MTEQIPTVGRTVHLTLSEGMARQINGARTQAGHATHTGNVAREGDLVPLIIVRVWDVETGNLNGQAILDGNDSYWASSVHRGETGEPGTWSWPELIPQLERSTPRQ